MGEARTLQVHPPTPELSRLFVCGNRPKERIKELGPENRRTFSAIKFTVSALGMRNRLVPPSVLRRIGRVGGAAAPGFRRSSQEPKAEEHETSYSLKTYKRTPDLVPYARKIELEGLPGIASAAPTAPVCPPTGGDTANSDTNRAAEDREPCRRECDDGGGAGEL